MASRDCRKVVERCASMPGKRIKMKEQMLRRDLIQHLFRRQSGARFLGCHDDADRRHRA